MKKTIKGVTFSRHGYGADDYWSAYVGNQELTVSDRPDDDGEWWWRAGATEGPWGVKNGRLLSFETYGRTDSCESAMRAAAGAFEQWLRDLKELAALANEGGL